jgi:hypothetical protein
MLIIFQLTSRRRLVRGKLEYYTERTRQETLQRSAEIACAGGNTIYIGKSLGRDVEILSP